MTTRDERIPPEIGAKLLELLKRFKHVLLFKGLTVTLSAFLAAMLAALALDRLFLMGMPVRILISAAAAAVTLLTAWVYWLRPYLHRPDDVTMAATVEARHPELQERVTSTIEFIMDKEERPEFRGSEEMRHAVVEQAVESVKPVDFPEVVSAERARKSSMTAGFLVLVTVCIAVLWWGPFRQLFHRFAMPWANIARVSTTKITVQEPADKLVAKGESVHIAATVTPKSVDEATLYVEIEPERWIPVKMTSAEAGSFSHRLTDVTSSMRYQIRAGDAITRRYAITAVPRPHLTRIDLHYRYPEYTKLTAKEELDAPGDIRAVMGTEVTLTVTVSKHVDVARLEMTGLARPMEMRPVGPRRYEARFPLTTGGLYVPRFQDEFGFTNQDEEVRQVIADPDARPVVTITRPERNIKLHWASRLPVTIEVTDDFGVNALAVVYRVDEGEEKEFPVELATVGSPTVNRTYRWGLAALKLKPGNIITYHARATDNRPSPGPNVGLSADHTIVITSPSVGVDRDVRREQIARIKRAMSKLKEQLESARRQVAPMKKAALEKAMIQEWQDRNKQAAQQQLKEAEPTSKQLTEMLRKDPLMDVLTPKSEAIEKQHIPQAQKATEAIQASRPLHLSQQPVEKANEEIEEALRKLDEMAKEMKRLEEEEERERQIAEMAERENQLAAEADKVQPDQKDLADQIAEKQDMLKDLLDKFMDENLKQEAIQQGMDEFNQMRQDIQDLLGKEKDLKGRTEEAIRKKLEELKQRQADLNKEAGEAKPDVQPKLDDRQAGKMPQDEMKKALDAMQENKLGEAVGEQKKAEDRMRQQADALRKPVPQQEGQPEKPAAPREADRVQEMAREQENIRRELAALAGIPQPDRRMEDIQRRQEALKKDAEALERDAQPQVNAEQPRGEEAPRQMQQAVDEMKRQTPREALPHQDEAARELDELAQNLQKQAEAAQPEAKPAPEQLARKAGDLAQKQRDLKQELENALPAQDQQMQQLARDQQQIEQDARELGQEMKEMAGAIEQVLPQAAQQARKAQQAMQRAPEHMKDAGQDLEAGQAEPATGDEQKAIDALAQADAEVGKLGEELAQALEEMTGQPHQGQPHAGNPEVGMSLAKALGQMKDASALMRMMQSQQGSQTMQQAANHLASAAQKMMQQGRPHQGQPHMSQSLNPKGIRGIGRKPEDLEKLKELKLTAEEWNRLPGELKEQLLQAMKGRYPEEYRELIRDYFRRLAKTGVKLDPGK